MRSGLRERVNTPGKVDRRELEPPGRHESADDLLADHGTIERLAKLAAETGRARPK